MKTTSQTPSATLPLPSAPRQRSKPLFTPVPLTRHELAVIRRALLRAEGGCAAAIGEDRTEYWLMRRTVELHMEVAA